MGYILPVYPYPYGQYVTYIQQSKKIERGVAATNKITSVRLKPEEMYEQSIAFRRNPVIAGKGKFIDYYC